jgi:hypothetical protein
VAIVERAEDRRVKDRSHTPKHFFVSVSLIAVKIFVRINSKGFASNRDEALCLFANVQLLTLQALLGRSFTGDGVRHKADWRNAYSGAYRKDHQDTSEILGDN